MPETTGGSRFRNDSSHGLDRSFGVAIRLSACRGGEFLTDHPFRHELEHLGGVKLWATVWPHPHRPTQIHKVAGQNLSAVLCAIVAIEDSVHCRPPRKTVGVCEVMIAGKAENIHGDVLEYPSWKGIMGKWFALETGQCFLTWNTNSNGVGDVIGYPWPEDYLPGAPLWSFDSLVSDVELRKDFWPFWDGNDEETNIARVCRRSITRFGCSNIGGRTAPTFLSLQLFSQRWNRFPPPRRVRHILRSRNGNSSVLLQHRVD